MSQEHHPPTAAAAFNVCAARIGELDSCRRRDDDLAVAYRNWLNAA
jgi:hypothetical protein